MKRFVAIFVTVLTVFVSEAEGQKSASQQLPMMHMSGLLRLVETVPLPGDGYMDHLAVDVNSERLFISGEAAKSIITVDLRAGKVIHVTQGLSAMPKKPFYIPETNEIWATVTDSSVVAISGTTYEVTKTVKLSGYGDPNKGADNAAYDPAAHLIYACVEVFEDFGGSGRPEAIVARSTSLTRKRPSWWAALSSRAVIRRASQSSHRGNGCTSPWEILWEVTAMSRSSISKNAPW